MNLLTFILWLLVVILGGYGCSKLTIGKGKITFTVSAVIYIATVTYLAMVLTPFTP